MFQFNLSTHALDRVTERLSMPPDEVLEAIVTRSVELPSVMISRRRYRMFWSIPDNWAFIAVVNKINGDVITLLPAEWSNGHEACIKDYDENGAFIRVVVFNEQDKLSAKRLAGIVCAEKNASSSKYDYEVSARFITREGKNKRVRIAMIVAGESPDEVMPEFISDAQKKSEEHGWLCLVVELHKYKEICPIQEWALGDSIAFNLEDFS